MIRVPNLYRHDDGGLYCLLSEDAPMKCPVTGDWLPGVIYIADDGRMRSTTRARWDDRFSPVAAIHEDKLTESQMAMIRRTNPGDLDLDFLKVLESWHEAEMGITGHALELAVVATMHKISGGTDRQVTITAADLRHALESYDVERVPVPNGFTIRATPA